MSRYEDMSRGHLIRAVEAAAQERTLLETALDGLLGAQGYYNVTDDELRDEERAGNGLAAPVLAARAALAAVRKKHGADGSGSSL